MVVLLLCCSGRDDIEVDPDPGDSKSVLTVGTDNVVGVSTALTTGVSTGVSTGACSCVLVRNGADCTGGDRA